MMFFSGQFGFCNRCAILLIGLGLVWSTQSAYGQSSLRSTQTPTKKKTYLTLAISSNSSAALGSQQRWMKALENVGADRVASSTLTQGAATVEETERGGTRYIRVQGFLERGKLELSGGSYRLGEIGKIRDLLQKFRDDGKETTLAQKHDFGLTSSQLVSLAEKLAKPVAEPTKGKPFSAVVNAIASQTGVSFVRDSTARAALAGQTDVTQEFEGMASGTALAVLVKPLGLVLQPDREQGQQVQVHIKRPEAGKKSWPVGRELESAPVLVEPRMFQKLPIGIKNYPLDKVMAAFQQKAQVPFIYDDQVIAAEGIEVSKTLVSISNKNGNLMVMINKLLRETKPKRLSGKLRVDDAGKAFLWVTAR